MLPPSSSLIALMMEAASTSQTSVNSYQTTRRNIQEDSHLHIRRRENLKSHRIFSLFVIQLLYDTVSIAEAMDYRTRYSWLTDLRNTEGHEQTNLRNYSSICLGGCGKQRKVSE
jgi:hypothetical protein